MIVAFAILQIVLAYGVADFLSSMFHYVTDKGWNPSKRITAQIMKHHAYPQTMTFDLEPVLAGLPLMLLGLIGLPWFFVSLGLFISIAQIPHYYSHHYPPRWWRVLQQHRIVLNPADHASHHSGDFDKDYSVLNGWTNPLVNAMVAGS
jgi:hypothetical protein